jgi:hypothetical protein
VHLTSAIEDLYSSCYNMVVEEAGADSVIWEHDDQKENIGI